MHATLSPPRAASLGWLLVWQQPSQQRQQHRRQVARAVRRLRAPRIALRSAASTSLHALPCDVQGSSAGHRTWRARLLAGARSRARSELGERARGTLGQRAGGRAGVGLTPDSRVLRACPHGQVLCHCPSRRHPVRRVRLERPETPSGSAAGSGQLGAAAALSLVSRGTSSRGGRRQSAWDSNTPAFLLSSGRCMLFVFSWSPEAGAGTRRRRLVVRRSAALMGLTPLLTCPPAAAAWCSTRQPRARKGGEQPEIGQLDGIGGGAPRRRHHGTAGGRSGSVRLTGAPKGSSFPRGVSD